MTVNEATQGTKEMNNPKPVHLKTDDEVRIEGWAMWARDADGHLVSCCMEMTGEHALEWLKSGLTVIPSNTKPPKS